ncbi:non-specific lipid transfer protein GPI-anchored 7-like [Zingiber officinale]|uniref:non-specific lipid transfer protein GPI-anchored 7-like n=1 Tax=Zingiber officinale TaxID=94328 RepID=UPI001C4CE158|nr:non-specific lipid transfer protein GPI-anchored 7-like [Zingiber officinale]
MANKIVFLMAVVVVAVVTKVKGQSPPECVAKLYPCKGQLNSTSPSRVCCLALQEVVRNDFACICSSFNNPSLLKTFNITSADAYRIAEACGSDLSACSAPSPYNPSASSKKGDNIKIAWFSVISSVFSWLSMTMIA